MPYRRILGWHYPRVQAKSPKTKEAEWASEKQKKAKEISWQSDNSKDRKQNKKKNQRGDRGPRESSRRHCLGVGGE